MGMPSIFDPRKADLFGIDGEKDLYVSSALHKAFVDVNEEGTEAAAATAIIVTLTDSVQTPVPIFKADHPFIFVIQDTETGNILFMGRVADPTI
jgi:serpin B